MDETTGAPATTPVIRNLVTDEDRAQCVALQEATWGAGFSECVPAAILLVGPKVGGITAGAFDADGRLVAFVFGLTGPRHGVLAHWSDMLAVIPELRGTNLGTRLKQWQRARCLEMGVKVIYWTWDPLVSRNSHLNLNKLGARVDEFVPNMYGVTDSTQMGALPTDRFVAAWDLEEALIAQRLAARTADVARLAGAPLVAGGPEIPPPAPWPDVPAVRVAIPHDFPSLLNHDFRAASAYRTHTMQAFVHYFALGYQISSFHPNTDGDGAYLLTRATS